MDLSINSRPVGDIAVVKCVGRIIEGAEAAALRQHIEEVLSHSIAIVLDLGDVQFIDSGGLGLLVRILSRTGQGRLNLCAVPPRINEMLRITRLAPVFDCYDSEFAAVSAFYMRAAAPDRPGPLRAASIICVETSANVLTYVAELLRQAGFSVTTAANVPDAIVLLKATRPKIVVVSSELRAARSTPAADAFNRLLDSLTVIELPAGFSGQDPSQSGQQLLNRIQAVSAAGT